ncbi:TonB-dependent receptor [Halopseudomonas pachastrellae]|nr:TonB-dependent receptor [Halopseudomonas pachastrellae]
MSSVSHTSPKLGIRSQPLDWLELRGSWAEGFAIAPDTAKYELGAGSVSPNVFRQIELGMSLTWRDLGLDLATYRIDSSDEIGRNPAGDYENFGETRRHGVEWLATGISPTAWMYRWPGPRRSRRFASTVTPAWKATG